MARLGRRYGQAERRDSSDDEMSTDMEDMENLPPNNFDKLVDDEASYRGPPAEGYENSRGAAITGFRANAGINAADVPVDFGFMFQRAHEQQTPPPPVMLPMERTSNDNSNASSPNSSSPMSNSPNRILTPHSSGEIDDNGIDETLHRRTKKRGLSMEVDSRSTEDVDCVLVKEPFSALKKSKLSAPQPPKRPHQVVFGNIDGEDRGANCMDPPMTRTDVFFWMRDDTKQNDEVLRLLREEEDYTTQETEHLTTLRGVLHEEMRAHMKEADKGIPTLYPGGYAYYSCSFEGMDYNKHFRVRISPDGTSIGEEEFLLDENELNIGLDGEKKPFCSVSEVGPSPDHSILSYATDFEGDESYTIHFKDLRSAHNSDRLSRALPESLENTTGSICWNPCADRFFYVTLDNEKRPEAVKTHMLGQQWASSEDEVLFEEPDKKFCVSIDQTSCGSFLIVSSSSSETTEHLLLDFRATGNRELQLVAQRSFSRRYSLDYRAGYFYILTNKDAAKDSKLCCVSELDLHKGVTAWKDLWTPNPGVCLESLHCFESFMAIAGRENGLSCIFIYDYDDANVPVHAVAFPEMSSHIGSVLTPRGQVKSSVSYSACIDGSNKIFSADKLRCSCWSFTNPGCTYEYQVKDRTFKKLKAEDVPSYDENLYRSDVIESQRRKVPISLVYHKGIHPEGLRGGPFPVLLTGYGAYGCCSDADFDGNRLSLLDRGVVYAVAHIRGGGELGRTWYEQGRYMEVKNRFQDFIDAAETLVNLGITESSKLTAWGTSSGGLLVGASVNLRPDLFRAVLMEVPFVDVLNTMCDPSIPLTVAEWEEIGNPNEREYFYYMSEYSAYDNLRMQDYPAFMITASLNDSMVGYWEPLKYISKLRLVKTNNRPTLLKVNFHAGHGGVSSRYDSIKEYAFHFAFLLEQMGLGTSCLKAQ